MYLDQRPLLQTPDKYIIYYFRMRMEYSSLACEQCEFLDKIGDDLDIQHISRSQEHYLELTHVSDMAGRF